MSLSRDAVPNLSKASSPLYTARCSERSTLSQELPRATMWNPTKERAKCSDLWRVSPILYLKEAFPLHSNCITPRGKLVCRFVRINSLNKTIVVRTAAVGHFPLSWRSDDHWSYLGKIGANKRSGLNPVKIWRTPLFSVALGYRRVPVNLLLRFTVTHLWSRRGVLVNVPGACAYRRTRIAGQVMQTLPARQ